MAGGRITGRSACPHCQRTLRWWELVPLISFTLLQGCCRRCRAPLSLQYPIIEFTMGVLTLFILWPTAAVSSGSALALGFMNLAIISCLVVLFVIDLYTFLLPDFFISLLGALVIVRYLLDPNHLSLTLLIFGAAVGSGALFLLWLLTKKRGIGLGDVKLLIPLGLLFGVSQVVFLLWLAFIVGGVVSIGLLWSGRATMKTAVPFGPFLTGSAVLLLLFPQTDALFLSLWFR